ncbi:hypothetical protein ABIB62_003976 [Mucilaginibacter sp. UYP25]|uniref:hypothetical protein n=1 Tax=unclassified Mucilaginibacter TaxID=2617802 RepID=UPI00339957A4
MIAALFNRYNFLRVAVSILLILFIGCKIAAPIFAVGKLSVKEALVTTQDNDSDSEKKADAKPFEKEFASFYSNNTCDIVWHTYIVHLTAYNNNYRSTYYQTITIPPPDRA